MKTKEEIIDCLMEMFYNRSEYNERKIVGLRGCKTYGTIAFGDVESPQFCGDSECPGCSMFHEALKEEASAFLKVDKDFIKGKE